ncbi:MAG: acetyl-CoA carboxylase biotin carboxyl carrier protein [Balneolaceae bacterium]
MDLKLIKSILTLISESDVNEVAIEEGDFKIKVKKSADIEQVTYSQPMAQQSYAQAPAASPAASAPASTEAAPKPAAEGEVINSPIVGTYYKSPSPGSDPFLNIGDKVNKGQTLCIVEAMKIMNEIEAEFSGTVVEILVTDGQAVEFDQPLFIIKKD